MNCIVRLDRGVCNRPTKLNETTCHLHLLAIRIEKLQDEFRDDDQCWRMLGGWERAILDLAAE